MGMLIHRHLVEIENKAELLPEKPKESRRVEEPVIEKPVKETKKPAAKKPVTRRRAVK